MLDDADQRIAAEELVRAGAAVRDRQRDPGRAAAVADDLRAADAEGLPFARDLRPAGDRRRAARDLALLDDADDRIGAEPGVAALAAAADRARDPVAAAAVADGLGAVDGKALTLVRDLGPAGDRGRRSQAADGRTASKISSGSVIITFA